MESYDEKKRSRQKPATAELEPKSRQKVFYASNQSHTHHLFKLEMSHFQKNIALQNEPPRFEATEHVHYFHTIDSNGTPQAHCSDIGGHFHEMTVIPSDDPDYAPEVICGPPMRRSARKDRYGRWQRVIVPFHEGIDEHTHDLKYMGASTVSKKKLSEEAQKALAKMTMVPPKPQGVEGDI